MNNSLMYTYTVYKIFFVTDPHPSRRSSMKFSNLDDVSYVLPHIFSGIIRQKRRLTIKWRSFVSVNQFRMSVVMYIPCCRTYDRSYIGIQHLQIRMIFYDGIVPFTEINYCMTNKEKWTLVYPCLPSSLFCTHYRCYETDHFSLSSLLTIWTLQYQKINNYVTRVIIWSEHLVNVYILRR